MKRSLVFCAIALVAVAANSALAVINVQLNIRYDDPNNELGTGSWELLAGSDSGGLAGLVVLIDGLYADNTENDAAFAGGTDFDVFRSQTVGGVTEIVIGSDLVTPSTDIGQGSGTTGNQEDDLFSSGGVVGSPTIWENNALLASGSLLAGKTRANIQFVSSAPNGSSTLNEGANEFDVNDAAVLVSLGMMSVRGDSVATDGLSPGDINRDGAVGPADLAALGSNWDPAGAGNGWDDGDFFSDGNVGPADLAALGSNWDPAGGNTTPPAIGAVPEPGSIVLFAIASLGFVARRRS